MRRYTLNQEVVSKLRSLLQHYHRRAEGQSDEFQQFQETITSILRHFDQDERESDGSTHWDGIKSVLLRGFVRDGVQDFSDEVWLQKIFEGSSKTRMEYCKNKDAIYCYLQAIQGNSGGIAIGPELMSYVKSPSNWKKYK